MRDAPQPQSSRLGAGRGRAIPVEEIDERYLDAPYYIAPDGKVGTEAFAVIRETARRMNMVALGRVVLTMREHVVAIEPMGKGLLATTLRYPYEVRSAEPYFDEIPDARIDQQMIDLASHIVKQKAGHFDPAQFSDRYETALAELLRRKQRGLPAEKPVEVSTPRVINLMDALRKSIEGAGVRPEAAKAEKKPAASSTKRRATATAQPVPKKTRPSR